MKAFCIAFAILAASLPARADDLPSIGSAGSGATLAPAPGSFEWVVVDDGAGPAAKAQMAPAKQDPPPPARAALSQMRVEMQRVLADARRTDTKVERVRFELRVTCEMRVKDHQPVQGASVPYIWNSAEEKAKQLQESLELCEVDYAERVRVQAQQAAKTQQQPPEMRDFQISFPVKD